MKLATRNRVMSDHSINLRTIMLRDHGVLLGRRLRHEGEVSKSLFNIAKPTGDSMPLNLYSHTLANYGHTNTSFYGNEKVKFSKEFMEAAYMAMLQFKPNTNYGNIQQEIMAWDEGVSPPMVEMTREMKQDGSIIEYHNGKVFSYTRPPAYIKHGNI